MTRSLCIALAFFALPAALAAQEEASAKIARTSKAAVVEAFAVLEKAQADAREVSAKASEKAKQAPTEEERAAARKEYQAAVEGPNKRVAEAREAFVEAFLASDWNAFDPTTDANLLSTGLFAAGQRSLEKEPALARRALTALVEKCPQSREATSARTYLLPAAFAATGEFETGVAFLRKAVNAAPEADERSMRIAIGDLLAATGSAEAARAEYGKAVEGIPEELEARDPRNRTKRDAELRLALVGEEPPEIDTETWIGGSAKPLSALRGKVVVLDFWATWCGPCRHVMPALSRLYEERKGGGLVVLGVTRFYDNGYLPANPEQMQTGGESVKGMDETSFLEHLKAFKANSGIAYPFVVGTKDDFENYKVAGIPTVVVIDKSGKACFVGVGSGSETSVRAAVDRALARPN